MSLKKSAAAGVRWTTVSLISTTLMETIRLVVLGRLLPPATFGIMAMILVVIGFGQVISQMGLVQAVIQRPEPKANELASLYWLNLAMGLSVYFVLMLSSPLITMLYSSPGLKPLIPYVGLMFVINPLGDLYRAMLQKNLRFKALAGIEITGTLIGMITSIFLAFRGFDVWSLVWGQLVMVVWLNLGFFLKGQNMFRLRFHFAKNDLQGYLKFGLLEAGSMSLNYFNSRIDQLIIGALIGPQGLGYYSMAFNLIMRPVQKINPILTRVAFPILSQVQNDNERMKRGYFTMLNLLSSVNAPILIGLAVVAPVVVPVFLGSKWTPIVPVVQVLSLFSLLRSMGNAGGSMILAKGRPDMGLYWNSLFFCLTPVMIFCAAYFGDLIAIAWSLLILQIFMIFSWYTFIVRKLLGRCFKEYVFSFGKPFVLAAVMGSTVLLFSHVYPGHPTLFYLLTQVAVGGISYVGLYALLDRNTVYKQMGILFNR